MGVAKTIVDGKPFNCCHCDCVELVTVQNLALVHSMVKSVMPSRVAGEKAEIEHYKNEVIDGNVIHIQCANCELEYADSYDELLMLAKNPKYIKKGKFIPAPKERRE